MKTMTERMRRRNILELSRMRHEQKLSEQSLKSGRRQLGTNEEKEYLRAVKDAARAK